MSYSADTFVADEIPTTSKWNKLWNNDASFNDGTGLADSSVIARIIAAAAVTPEKLLAGTGTTWPWTAYTPSIAAASGTFTAASATGAYKQIGKTVIGRIEGVVTTIGTGSGMILGLPFASIGTQSTVGYGRESSLTGNICSAFISTSSTISIARYDNGNIVSGGSGATVRVSFAFEAA